MILSAALKMVNDLRVHRLLTIEFFIQFNLGSVVTLKRTVASSAYSAKLTS